MGGLGSGRRKKRQHRTVETCLMLDADRLSLRGNLRSTLERPGHLVSPAFRNDATTRCSESVHSLRKSIFFYSRDNAPYHLIRTEIADAHQHEHCPTAYGVSARRA